MAATACRPHPSNAHAAQQQARHLPQQGQAQELDKDGQSSTSEQISQASVQLTEQQRQQHDLQLVRAEEEAAGVEAAVLELWPGFANAHGREAVLQPGDALYVPAGAFVHTESLECGAVDSSASASATEEAQLPGNVMMVVDLWAASPALAPRSRGALEMQVSFWHGSEQSDLQHKTEGDETLFTHLIMALLCSHIMASLCLAGCTCGRAMGQALLRCVILSSRTSQC